MTREQIAEIRERAKILINEDKIIALCNALEAALDDTERLDWIETHPDCALSRGFVALRDWVDEEINRGKDK